VPGGRALFERSVETLLESWAHLASGRDSSTRTMAMLSTSSPRSISRSVLSAHAVMAARERGCTTASLQSTAMAEGVYARVGFRDLGPWEEYVPPVD
jgi:hypothetical protein